MAKPSSPNTSRSNVDLPAQGRGAYGPVSRVHDEMDRLFDRFFGGISWPSWRGGAGDGELRVPEIDLSENDEEYCVEADMPGLDEKDISLTLSNGVLTVKAKKKEDSEETKKSYHLAERRWHAVQRSLRLPEEHRREQGERRVQEGGADRPPAEGARDAAGGPEDRDQVRLIRT